MVMANYSEFNNNNYLPGFYSDMATAAFPQYPATTQFRSPGAPQNGFTFTSPTQVSTLATYRPSIQTTSPISNLSAPGVGTSWQHSIPVTMPWVDMKAAISQRGLGTATVFTGVPLPAYPEPLLSGGIPARCPKRKALDLPDEAPMSKVYLCADQFANMKISPGEQQQQQLRPPSGDSGSASVQFYAGRDRVQSKSDIEGWQRFREVESRLDVEVDEDLDLNMSSNNNSESGPRLKVAEGILKDTPNNSPILPRKVMEDITKPCMQIVLWKSPGEHIRDASKEDGQTTASSTTSTTDSIVDSSKYSQGSKTTDVTERFPLTPRDNIMEASGDMMMLDSSLNLSLPSQHSTSSCSLSTTGFMKPPSPSSRVTLSTGGISSSRINTSSSNNSILGDLDMFDSMDDEMQL